MSPTEEKTIHLLLVDDEQAFVNVLLKRLAKRHIQVTPAYSGVEALQRLNHDDFDVAILDLKMEGLDGIEVLKLLNQLIPKLPIIMLTGHGSQISAQEAFANGAFAFLSKPYDFEDLLLKIHEAYNSGMDAP